MHNHEETQIMEHNLNQIIKNQNYFSCFIDSNQPQESEPVNPFLKKLFDKNLRRSTLSCGHYNSTSNNHQVSIENESFRLGSSRKNMKENITESDGLQPLIKKVNEYENKSSEMINLRDFYQLNPIKEQITHIINNFRHELDYLEEKLYSKLERIEKKYNNSINESERNRETNFMIESLEKIIGFMIENCVNLEDRVMYGNDENDSITSKSNTLMKKEIYYIQNDEIENSNISFSRDHDHDQNLDKYNKNEKIKQNKTKIAITEKENLKENLQSENYLNYCFVNNKPHLIENHRVSLRGQKETAKFKINTNERLPKVTTKVLCKGNQKQIISGQEIHGPSSKESLYEGQVFSSSEEIHPKSIYETVLEEREMRIKMKKRMI